jgi:hypothetical protein
MVGRGTNQAQKKIFGKGSNDTEKPCLMYVEHMLIQRATFACTQKHDLVAAWRSFPPIQTKEMLKQQIDEELIYLHPRYLYTY